MKEYRAWRKWQREKKYSCCTGKKRELTITQWGGPEAAKTSPKDRVRVLQTQKRPVTAPCESLWRRVASPTAPGLGNGTGSAPEQTAEARRTALVFCARYLLLLHTHSMRGNGAETWPKGSQSTDEPEAAQSGSNRGDGHWLARKVSLSHWNLKRRAQKGG